MKYFLIANWYRLVMAFSALIFSIGFTIWTTKYNTAKAGEPVKSSPRDLNPSSKIVSVGRTIYAVTWNSSYNRYDVEKLETVSSQ